MAESVNDVTEFPPERGKGGEIMSFVEKRDFNTTWLRCVWEGQAMTARKIDRPW